MATCKDCIHYEVCKDYIETLAKAKNADLEAISKWLDEMTSKSAQTDCECEHFKDRSRFVELPCKIGSTIYHIENGKIVEYIVFATHTYSRKSRNKHKLFLTLPSDGRIHLVINDFDMANGKTIFLTKEQAEQALKEREDNV